MSTGPITVFDKSFLQSLSLDESVWFDRFYITVVCPVFYAETLADLSKNLKGRRTAEGEVAKIAAKFPDLGGTPCMNHVELCLADLHGQPVGLKGRIPVPGGSPVRSGDRSAYVFRNFPETEAFMRWQQQEFQYVEVHFARQWRESLSNLNLNQVADFFRRNGIDSTRCKSLENAKAIAEGIVTRLSPYEQMRLAVLFLNMPREYHQSILERWQDLGLKPISEYAPYAAYVLEVELFFQISVASHLIAAERPSNRIDIGYLFYLPFCSVFVSSDKLHRRCVPLFLRRDQEFVWGTDLKADLAKLNERYSSLPEEIKDLGVLSFASTPPHETEFLTSQLWDRHMNPNWRDRPELQTEMPRSDPALVEYLNSLTEGDSVPPQEVDFDSDDATGMSIQRQVRRNKGGWLQVPKDLPDEED